MKVVYRGECDELYGCEIEYPDHDCTDYARFRRQEFVETHGLDCGPYELWAEEWHECSVCGQIVEAA